MIWSQYLDYLKCYEYWPLHLVLQRQVADPCSILLERQIETDLKCTLLAQNINALNLACSLIGFPCLNFRTRVVLQKAAEVPDVCSLFAGRILLS
jgi:hypothetical protein